MIYFNENEYAETGDNILDIMGLHRLDTRVVHNPLRYYRRHRWLITSARIIQEKLVVIIEITHKIQGTKNPCSRPTKVAVMQSVSSQIPLNALVHD